MENVPFSIGFFTSQVVSWISSINSMTISAGCMTSQYMLGCASIPVSTRHHEIFIGQNPDLPSFSTVFFGVGEHPKIYDGLCFAMSRGQRRVLLMIWSGKWRFIMDCGLQSVDTAYIYNMCFVCFFNYLQGCLLFSQFVSGCWEDETHPNTLRNGTHCA